MTKRALPLLPHPHHLRKQAKARLAAMRESMPTARLADAQSVLAGEYGFATWSLLLAEVACRTSGSSRRASLRRADLVPLHAQRFQAPPDPDSGITTHLDFFRLGVIAQIAFTVTALTGMALVFVAIGPPRGLIATSLQIGRPLARLIHAIL